MSEEEVHPGTLRARRRRARLREEGVIVVELELESQTATQLSQAAELANISIGRLASVIIKRHFENRRGGRKRQPQSA